MHDAIVVGAGLSGLVCARRLIGAGVKTLVLEGRDRVGGRLFTGTVGGVRVDLGGAWLTAGQDRLLALAGELGVATQDHARRGRAVVDEEAGFFASIAAAFAQRRATKLIESMMDGVPEGEPMQARDAALLDATTLAAFLKTSVPNGLARERIGVHADLVFAQDPASVSLLAYLATMRATGGFSPAGRELPGGGHEHRFVDGAQTLAERLAERVGAANVRLGAPVTEIAEDDDAVVVRCRDEEHRAPHVVLAIPPALVARLAIDLPPPQRAYVDGVRAGGVVKVFAAYARPFWRERGMSGEAYLPRGTVRATVDATPTATATSTRPTGGVLLAFIVGDEASRWAGRDVRVRQADVLATLATHFGEDALRPVDLVEHDWAADPFAAGCVAATPPHTLAGGGRWRESFGRIHVAGTESALAWPGYMDGAIEAGERAATDVLAARR